MIRIITDSTSVLPPEIASRYNIPIIPQIINFGEETYYEGVDIDIETFMYKLQKSNTLPKTAAPPPELFRKEFDKLVPKSETIICIHPSAEVSGTVRSASVAALEFPQSDIRVIDTRIIASPLGTVVQLAAEWVEKGISADIIVERVLRLTMNARLYFLVDTLKYLVRGGRIGNASALVGGVLQIKPILTFSNGKVDVYEKQRTRKKAISRIKEIVLEQLPRANAQYLSIMYTDGDWPTENFSQSLMEDLQLDQISIRNMPPAIITHGGPGGIGVGFFIGDIP
jgi:DegV family protein with EDD domain